MKEREVISLLIEKSTLYILDNVLFTFTSEMQYTIRGIKARPFLLKIYSLGIAPTYLFNNNYPIY